MRVSATEAAVKSMNRHMRRGNRTVQAYKQQPTGREDTVRASAAATALH